MPLSNFRCLNKGKTFLHCVEAVHLQRQDLSPPSQICRSSLRLSPAAPLAPIRKLGGKGTIHSSSSSRKSSQNPVALSAPPQTSGFSSLPPPHSHRLELGGDSGRVPSSGVGGGWGGGRAGLGGAGLGGAEFGGTELGGAGLGGRSSMMAVAHGELELDRPSSHHLHRFGVPAGEAAGFSSRNGARISLGLMQIGDGVRDAAGVSLRSGMTLLRAEQACLSTRGTRSWWLLQHPGPGQGALPPVALPPL
jgi:hypothetical protein